MAYEITATRKRPQGFEELAGQEFVSATLEASLASGRIAHAYLFSGPRGCGKTSTARILAKALDCEKGPSARPCGTCSNCVSIAAGSSLDVIEIDGASNTSVDNVRQIKDEVLFPPNSGRYKVYIIDEVHMLSMSAFNALLKTIEEPPPYVVFIFATTELHKVPATIKSRCQQFAFRLIPIDTIKGLLAEAAREMSVEAEDEALLWIAKESGGSLRDAYTLFDQVVAFSEDRVTTAKIRDKLGLVGLDAMNGLFESLVAGEGGTAAALEGLDGLLGRGLSPEQLTIDLIDYLRSLLLLRNGMGRENLIGAPAAAFSAKVLEALDSEKLERGLGLLLELHRNLRMSPNPRFELELAIARIARLRDFVSPAELARAVGALRGSLGQGVGASLPRSTPAKAAARGPSLDEEKKKPEPRTLTSPIIPSSMPASLSGALSSLAGAVLGGSSGKATSLGAEAGEEGGPELPRDELRAQPSPRPPEAPPSEEESVFASDEEVAARGQADADEPSSAFRRDVVARLRRSNPLLGSGLANSLAWTLEEDRLLVVFRNPMEESLVRSEMGPLAEIAAAVAGRNLRIELRVDAARPLPRETAVPERVAVDDAVAIVERMFRGQRLPRAQGETQR